MKTLVSNLVMPLPLVLLLLLGGVLLWILQRPRASRYLLGSGMVVLFLASWGPVADALLAPLERWHAPVMDAGVHAQAVAVVVLGAGYNSEADLPVTAQLSDSGVVRLTEGIRLYRQLPRARLLLAGEGFPPQEGYARAARALGVPEDDIVHLGTVFDTADEARAARAVLDPQAVFLLVTSASHMPRAVRHFQRVGLAPIPAPTRHKSLRDSPRRLDYWVPSSMHLRKTERALYEYMGMLSIELDH